ncbi:hypothetical protein QJS10_CPA10g01549 [Acorus calamus]|uniref:Uncharacterized protein n=1 Tax=Acorus calamus TaxID=4465 RepID=A0AAV9DZ68_ACOCL|nr:hypothetical protein QJS10_CPA10g01549 [Acorus calamus]
MEPKRTISLYCPTRSNLIIDFQTPKPSDEERGVNLGEVGRVFGLDPASVKLNGHFLSRGPDLVSRSVTWSSLLSYFSGRGFPDGRSVDRAVVVDGKPISQQKPLFGCAGLSNSFQCENGDCSSTNSTGALMKRKLAVEDPCTTKKRETIECGYSGPSNNFLCKNADCSSTNIIGALMKRKLPVEDSQTPKKRKTVDCGYSGEMSGSSNCIAQHLKRLRVDDMFLAIPCKRTR